MRDGKVILDTNREFAHGAAQALAKAKWEVSSVGEEEVSLGLFDAQQGTPNRLIPRRPIRGPGNISIPIPVLDGHNSAAVQRRS